MKNQRLISLDVFRGFTIILMTIVNNPGSWDAIYPQLDHAKWNGCTLTDLVFPFFIFILGTAIPFAMPSKIFDATAVLKIAVRSARIFSLGFFLAFFRKIEFFGLEGIPLLAIRFGLTIIVAIALLGNFSLKTKAYTTFSTLGIMLLLAYNSQMFAEVRIPGVLQRIGIVYLFVSILYLNANQKIQIASAALLLIGYWILMTFVPVPSIGAPNYDIATNFSAWLDSVLLPNHMYIETKTWDPEGVLSTFPAIATGIIGMQIGLFLSQNQTQVAIFKKMLFTGFVLTLLGYLWGQSFPINKQLWSSSYVLFTAGLATLCLSLLYLIIEILDLKKWTKLFLIWGVNPMIVFFFSGIIPRCMSMIKVTNPSEIDKQIDIQKYIYTNAIAKFLEQPINASLAGALVYVAIWSCILWIFYKRNLIFKV
jgi:predicted acyltransferase